MFAFCARQYQKIEAKGPGYLDMMVKGIDKIPWSAVENEFYATAGRQVAAAGDRPIEWYFAEKEVADYVRKLFDQWNFPIKVIYAPAPK